MGKICIWFWIFSKRYLKRVSFIFLLVILPIVTFMSSKIEQKEIEAVRIGLYTEDEGLATQIMNKLLDYDGYLTFYACESEEQLISDVETRKAECGYLFPVNMEANIQKGKTEDLIKVYSSPSTVLDKMTSEVVFSAFMMINNENVLIDYSSTSDIFSDLNRQEAKSEIIESYNQYIKDGNIFHFEYELLNIPSISVDFKESSVLPIRGIIAVYIFAIGLFSAVNWFRDKELGIFGLQSYAFEPWGNMIAIGTPVIWAGISGIAALLVSGDGEEWYYEMLIIILYVMAVIVFSDLLKNYFKSAISLCSIVPILIMGCLVFCPVFIDLKSMLKPLGIMEKLFLPYYYLDSFTANGMRSGVVLGLLVIIFSVISFIYYRFRRI